MTTMNHQYLATIFYSDDTIKDVLEKNTIHEFNENTDLNLINASIYFNNQYTSDYEKLVRNKDEPYKIIQIQANTYTGYLVAIYDPSKIKTAVAKCEEGELLEDIAKENNAVIAINGGMFEQTENGLKTSGITVSNGKIISQEVSDKGIIGFTRDNKLFLGKVSIDELTKLEIRDCVTFGPFLMVNGKRAEIAGNGGYGTAPRTAIGQRPDGTVLFLAIDGRKITSPGATMKDVTDIMERFGAINVANLDGGASTQLVVNGQTLNDVIGNGAGEEARNLVTSFILEQ